jgi:hypothetical protein
MSPSGYRKQSSYKHLWTFKSQPLSSKLPTPSQATSTSAAMASNSNSNLDAIRLFQSQKAGEDQQFRDRIARSQAQARATADRVQAKAQADRDKAAREVVRDAVRDATPARIRTANEQKLAAERLHNAVERTKKVLKDRVGPNFNGTGSTQR